MIARVSLGSRGKSHAKNVADVDPFSKVRSMIASCVNGWIGRKELE